MNARLSQYMTALGLGAMVFYGMMMASGTLTPEMMPQFVMAVAIFLTSGRAMRKAARMMARSEEDEVAKPLSPHGEPDWAWLSGWLNVTATFLIVGILTIYLAKPMGVSILESLSQVSAHDQFYSTAVP